jgi:hypothetical protein
MIGRSDVSADYYPSRRHVGGGPPACRWLGVLILLVLCGTAQAVELRVATFKADVTPPLGSPLCDALVPPAKEIADPLSARGIVLRAGEERPVVLVAVDWVGIGNEGHEEWRDALADACDTSRDRVCVHALHQHDAPGCDFLAERILAEAGLSGEEFPVEFAREAIDRVAAAAREAMNEFERVTHVSYGMGRVEKVASNRRILGPDGKVQYMRTTATRDPKIRAFPEGTIDPFVRLVGFWNAERPIAVLSYYATHPQSHYGEGSVSADYVGMARDQRQAEERADLHIHFNGAGGNIGAGKYNDGSPENRPILAGRLADGMKAAWESTSKITVDDLSFDWATRNVQLPLTERFDETERMAALHDTKLPMAQRVRAARDMAWARRTVEGNANTIARLRLGSIDILHLPGELFVEYQLAAQKLRPNSFVCVAAYGDYGPGYIGTTEAYSQGGYETGEVSRVSPRVEAVFMKAIQELLE